MRTGIYQSMRRVLNEVAMAECEGVWTATPQHVKDEILEVAMERSVYVPPLARVLSIADLGVLQRGALQVCSNPIYFT
jgi:hypothetical protein